MPADRRLSDLPGDMLRHVLSFALAKEAATTAVLSRQWRSLWSTSGAVNLDSRSYGRRFSVGMHEGFFHGAKAALGAACVPLRRLTFHVELEAKTHGEIEKFLLSRRKECWQHDMMGAVLSSPAARRFEELQVGVHRFGWPPTVGYTGGFYKLSYGALPSEALRVLHIANCRHLTPAPPGAAFPWLAEMRLQGCGVSLKGLQGMINIAPQLATLHLECIYLSDDDEEEAQIGSPAHVKCYRLCYPAATALVLANCTCPCEVQGGIELDVPRLRHLRFKGFICDRLSLQSSHYSLMLRTWIEWICTSWTVPAEEKTMPAYSSGSSKFQQHKGREVEDELPD